MSLPSVIEISKRLWHDVQMMLAYALESDAEAGGFLIKAQHGHLGVIDEQFGKGREITIEPNEQLYEGETYVGTVHVHPVTDTISLGDVSSFLMDETELVMVLEGADGSTNIAIKMPGITKIGEHRSELEQNYPAHDIEGGMSAFQKAIPQVANDYGFLFYRGSQKDECYLSLQNDRLLDEKIPTSNQRATIEDMMDAVGLQGLPDYPPHYATKKGKMPKKEA